MPVNLYAICRDRGRMSVKLVDLEREIQDQVEGVFADQMQTFFNGVDEEIPFNGGYLRASPNEMLTIDLTEEVNRIVEALMGNAVNLPVVEASNLGAAGIKGLFVGDDPVAPTDAPRIFAQRFTGGQVLSRKFTLFSRGDAFNRFRDPAFTLATSLTFVVEGDKVKFKSFSNLRTILDVTEIYREATDAEVTTFAEHPRVFSNSVEDLLAAADQVSRGLIYMISQKGILEKYSPQQIQRAAQGIGAEVELSADGRIVIPNSRRELKNLLFVLNENRYSGALTGTHYISSSHRPVTTEAQ